MDWNSIVSTLVGGGIIGVIIEVVASKYQITNVDGDIRIIIKTV